MKKIIFIATLTFISLFSSAIAGVVHIPAGVKEIKSATYSTGGGEKPIVYVKVHCLMNDGREVLFLAGKGSVSGMLGLGRWTLPEKIEFVKDNALKDKIVWKK